MVEDTAKSRNFSFSQSVFKRFILGKELSIGPIKGFVFQRKGEKADY